mgnify:CR=1 FL=1
MLRMCLGLLMLSLVLTTPGCGGSGEAPEQEVVNEESVESSTIDAPADASLKK